MQLQLFEFCYFILAGKQNIETHEQYCNNFYLQCIPAFRRIYIILSNYIHHMQNRRRKRAATSGKIFPDMTAPYLILSFNLP